MVYPLIFKTAETETEKRAAQKVIYQVFGEELGFNKIKPDNFDEWAHYAIAIENEKVIAALRIIPDSPQKLPIDSFLDLSAIRQDDVKLAEISRLVCLKEYRNRTVTRKGLAYFREFILQQGFTHLVIESFLEKADFYRFLGFTPFSEPFCDPTLINTTKECLNSLGMIAKVDELRSLNN